VPLPATLHENTRDVLLCYREVVVIRDCGRILKCLAKMQNCVLKFGFPAALNILKIVSFVIITLLCFEIFATSLCDIPEFGIWRTITTLKVITML
jgi:hypothetical protein